MKMEGESEAKAPLLVAAATDGRRLSSSSRRLRLSRRNSVNSFRQDFVSRLPDKLRPGLDLESASLIDFSKTTALTQGEKEYYERQIATLKSFEEVDSLMTSDSIDEEDFEEQAQQERAMKISNYANIILLAFKIYATIETGSIAIAASTLDSLLDLMAGGILWFTHLSMININIYKYPIGKLRVQPIGIIIFAAIMATLVSLVGQSAPPEVLQKMTYLVIRHPQVKHIDTVRAYTFGVLYFVEVDIELPEELPLKEAHLIGETLQIKIEKLPEVERAFVHLDYECQHKPEHSVLSRLPNRED
ncbi:hypothetical protein ACSBR2_033817 [Camellia fascicularis]